MSLDRSKCPRCGSPNEFIRDWGGHPMCSGYTWWQCRDKGCGWREFDGWDPSPKQSEGKTLTASECVDVVLQLEPILQEAFGYGTHISILGIIALSQSEIEVAFADFSCTPTRRFWKCIHKSELQEVMNRNNRRIHV